MFQLFEARGTEKWIEQLKNFGLYVKTENLYQCADKHDGW